MACTNGTSDVDTVAAVTLESLCGLLDCPVCFDTCIPPIYACRVGHNICKVCAPNIYRCPICRAGYLGTRDFVAEELHAKLQQAGLFAKEAPKDGSSGVESPIRCYLGTLNTILKTECYLEEGDPTLPNFDSYIDHLKDRHKVSNDTVELGSTFTKRYYWRSNSFVRNGSSTLLVLNCCDHSFLVSLHQNEENIYVFVAAKSEQVANGFKVDMRIPKSSDVHESLITWKGNVNDIKKTPQEILQDKSCLIIHEQALRGFGVRRIGTICSWALQVTITKTSSDMLSNMPGPEPRVRASTFSDSDSDLGNQIWNLQIDLDRLQQSNERSGTERVGFLTGERRSRGIDQLPAEESITDGSIRSRILNIRRLRPNNSEEVSGEAPGSSLEHQRAWEPRREMLERYGLREREERIPPRQARRILRRTAPTSAVITSRDFFTDSDEENAYIERLARDSTDSPNMVTNSQSELNNPEFPETARFPERRRFPLRHPLRPNRMNSAPSDSTSTPSPFGSRTRGLPDRGNPSLDYLVRLDTRDQLRAREAALSSPAEVPAGCAII